MIASLEGTLARKSPAGIVVEAGGVGYEVLVPLSTLYHLPDPGEPVRLVIHTHMRDSQILLVGFLGFEEREAYRLLTTVSGVGPRLAVSILAGLQAEELLETIYQGDAQRLCKIPGVGKRMAERIIVDLKDRVPPREVNLGRKEGVSPDRKRLFAEAVSALLNLGYKRKEAEKALEQGLGRLEAGRESVTVESLLKTSLRLLVKESSSG